MHFVAQVAQFQDALHAGHEAGFIDRFDQIIVGAALHALHRQLQFVAGGHDQHRNVGIFAADIDQQFLAGNMGHEQVKYDDTEIAFGQQGHDQTAVIAGLDLANPGAAQNGTGTEKDVGLVVDQQNRESVTARHHGIQPPCGGWRRA